MPTNLPPECKTLEKQYLEAKTLAEKITALQEYHSAIPKHKGTERLRSQIKRKLSKLRLEMEEKRQKTTGSSFHERYSLRKEGAAQVVILGFTNSGKSTLLNLLTNAKPRISEIPYTTIEPILGMMLFEDVHIQLIETPAVFKGISEGKGWGLKILSLTRNCDALIFLIDLSTKNPLVQFETIIEELEKSHIKIGKSRPKVEIERRKKGGIQFLISGNFRIEIDEIRRFLLENRYLNAIVKIKGETDLEDIALSLISGVEYKPVIIIANKIDIKDSESKLEILVKKYDKEIKIMGVSLKTGEGITNIPSSIFTMLDITRIYTKKPRQTPSQKPIIMNGKVTVEDVTRVIHTDFYKSFKYAKVWGSSKFPGERVGLRYLLKDKDTLEIHI
jgi:ribosome-interacting GTPase 1